MYHALGSLSDQDMNDMYKASSVMGGSLHSLVFQSRVHHMVTHHKQITLTIRPYADPSTSTNTVTLRFVNTVRLPQLGQLSFSLG